MRTMKSSTFKRIMGNMKGAYLSYGVGIVGLAITGFLIQATLALLFLNLFDNLAGGSFQAVLDSILNYIIYIMIIIAFIPFFAYLADRSAVITTGNIRKRAFGKLTRLPLRYFQQHHSAETISTLTNDIAETEKAYSEHLVRFLASIFTGIGTMIVMFILDWRIALIPVFAGLLTILVNSIFAKRLRTVSKDVQAQLAHVNTRLSNILAGMHVIRIFNIQNLILSKFKKQNKATLAVSQKRIKRLSLVESLNDLVFTIGFAGIVLLGSLLVLEGLTTIGVIIAIVQLQNGVSELVRMLGSFIANLQASLAAGERVFELIDQEEEPERYASATPLTGQGSAIALQDVIFSYESDQRVLDQLSLAIKHKQTVALVGPSGGGKSTVFKLLLQYYPVESGGMHIDGKPVDAMTIKAIRDQIAYVPQDAYLFNTTIRENIAYGKPDATEEDIITAAKSANAHDFIMELEQAYDTMVGEHGAKLSGGQRQRIAIARAMIKGAPILLLDEATSALDNASERLVQSALDKLMKDKTSVIIAHRLSTIEHADCIVVISRGKVQEVGTHETLLQKNDGDYKRLYQRQLKLSD
ncbi:MAG: ABC transporter ATP-binding protein [Acholeplasmatales bacterium]|nr:MAG: ABC transporter ATP-binding protein [Acholeplasmatales bacterium]